MRFKRVVNIQFPGADLGRMFRNRTGMDEQEAVLTAQEPTVEIGPWVPKTGIFISQLLFSEQSMKTDPTGIICRVQVMPHWTAVVRNISS
jgi:hypothetical protein